MGRGVPGSGVVGAGVWCLPGRSSNAGTSAAGTVSGDGPLPPPNTSAMGRVAASG
ncbi:Uncharacterised protein [Mycobacteroides abscessus subsp. abscessus]|nr:Uncharacterised protein [Mycobacteroides abscessus subsp. abscessus]